MATNKVDTVEINVTSVRNIRTKLSIPEQPSIRQMFPPADRIVGETHALEQFCSRYAIAKK